MLAAAGCFATSCSDDDGDNNQSADFVGSYKMTAYNGPSSVDFDGDGTSSINFMDESDCWNNSTMTLNANGTYTMSSNGMNIDSGTSSCSSSATATNGTWTRTGSTITTTQTSTGTGVGSSRSWAWSSGAHTLTNAQSNAQYPSFNSGTGLYSWSTGSVNSTYTMN